MAQTRSHSITSSAIAQHPWRNCQVERFCGLEIDDEIEFGRLQHGEVAGLFSLEDSSAVNARLAVGIDQVPAVAA